MTIAIVTANTDPRMAPAIQPLESSAGFGVFGGLGGVVGGVVVAPGTLGVCDGVAGTDTGGNVGSGGSNMRSSCHNATTAPPAKTTALSRASKMRG